MYKPRKFEDKSKKRSLAIVEPLEPRVLFSADVLSAALDHASVRGHFTEPASLSGTLTAYVGTHADDKSPIPSVVVVPPSSGDNTDPRNSQNNQDIPQTTSSAPSSEQATPLEVIFVDAGVNDSEILIENLRINTTNPTQWLVVDLAATEDGIEQITQTLKKLTGVDAIHILSHSDGTGIKLGNSWLDTHNAGSYSADFLTWGDFVDSEADLLIYGCDLASSEDGRDLMQAIGNVSNMDVAASDDITGHKSLGGDWDLEYTQGNVTTDAPFNDFAQDNWHNTLASASSGIELNTDGGNDAYLVTTNAGTFLGGVNSLTLEMQFSVAEISQKNSLFAYSTPTQSNEVLFFVQDDGIIVLAIDNGGWLYSTNTYTKLVDGDKHSMAVSWDQASGDVSFYVDGELAESHTGYAAGAVIEAGGSLIFGQESDAYNADYDPNQTFKGTLYDVRVWDDVRSNSEIALNHQKKLDPGAPTPANLVANWQMSGFTAANEVVDIAGSNNLSIGHVSQTGFTPSNPIVDLHISENASAGSIIGNIVPSGQLLYSDVVSDGLFTDAATPGTSQNYSNGQTIGSWEVVSTSAVTLHNADGSFQDTTPLGGNTIHLSNNAADAISQTLTTEPGKQYEVIFNASGHWDSSYAKEMRVSVESTTNTTTRTFNYDEARDNWNFGNSIVWEPDKLLFTADSTSTTLTFETVPGTGAQGILLSDVQVLEVPDTIATILANDPSLTHDTATGKFYRVVDNPMQFQSAVDAAIATTINGVNGQLATVNSLYENKIVHGLANSISKDVWIPGTDRDSPTDWFYLNGNDVGKQIWDEGSGAPPGVFNAYASGTTGDVLRAHYDSFDWSTTAQTNSNAYVIEWDANSILSTFTYSATNPSNNFAIDSQTGEITLLGTHTLDYEKSVFESFYITITDAAGNKTSTSVAINVAPFNEAPIFINHNNGSNLYHQTATVLDPDVEVSDPELSLSDNFNGSTLTLQRIAGANGEDVFSAAGSLGPLTEGGSLTYNSNVVGSVTTNSAGTLVLTFNSNATNALVNSVMQSIAYSNSNNPNIFNEQIDWTFNDENSANSQGAGIALSTSASTTVTAVNDPPVVTLPGNQITDTDSTLVLSGTNAIQVNDADIGNNEMDIEINVTDGTISLASVSGLTILSGDGTDDVVFAAEGTKNDVNTALDGMIFTPAPGFIGMAQIEIILNDLGNTGAGGAKNDNKVLYIEVGINDDPTHNNTLPSDITVSEDTASNVDLSLMDIEDVDAGSDDLTVTLTTTNGGLLSSAGNVDVSVMGNNSNSLTLTGNQTALNAFFDQPSNIAYTGTQDTYGNNADTINVSVTDNGSTGAGGGGDIDFGDVAVNINAVNDDPVNTGSSPASIIATEDTSAHVNLSLIEIEDIDAGSNDLTISLATGSGGTLSAANGSGIVISSGGPGLLSLTGSQSALNSYLNQPSVIQYLGAPDATGTNADTIQVTVDDNNNTGTGGNSPVDFGTIRVDISEVNDDPINTGSIPPDIAVTEDITGDIDLSLIDLADVDSNSGDLSLSLTTTVGGTIASISGSGVTVTGSGSNLLTLTGTLTDLNNFLNVTTNIQYTSATNAEGTNADTIQVAVTDNGNTGTGGGTSISLGTVSIDIDAVNDDPINTGSIPTNITVTEDITGDIDLSLIDLADVDSNSGDLSLSLTTTVGSTLASISGSGVTVTGSGSNLLTLTGTLTDLNNFLNVTTNIQYTSATNAEGTNADTIQVAVTDNGNTGTGGGTSISLGTVSIDIDAVNDDPVNTGSIPTNITVTEDITGDIDLSLIDLADVDSNSGDLSLSLTTTVGGTLASISGSGVTVTGSGSNLLTLTGTLTELNNFLNVTTNIQYTSATNAEGTNADTIQIEVTDNGNTGTGGGTSISLGTVSIDIDAVNDDPINTGSIPTNITVTEDITGDIDLSLINLTDVDSNSGDLSLTLTTAAGGTLVAASSSGVLVVGSGTGGLTLSGTQTDLNTYLNVSTNIQFTSALNANGTNADSIEIEITDNGNTGTGGSSNISLGTANIDIEPVNDDPKNNGSLPTDIDVIEDLASDIDLSLVDLADVDSATGNLTLTLATAAGGTLDSIGGAGISVTGGGSSQLTLTGTQADLNTFLSITTNIQFTNAPNANGNNADAIQVGISDNGNTGTGGGSDIDLGTVNINIDAINDDPQNVGSLPTDITVIEDVASDLDLRSIDLLDVDAATENLTLTLTTTTGGTLTASNGTGVTAIGSGSAQLTLTGTQTDLNSFLNVPANIQFTSALNINGNDADTIRVDISDNGNIGTGGGSTITLGSINIDIAAVNDDPENIGSLPLDIVVTEDVQSDIDLSLIELSDIDTGSGNLSITLTTTGGRLEATGNNGVSVTGSDTNQLTLAGTQTDLNTYLSIGTHIQYTSATNAAGTNADTIQVEVTDNGNIGTGGGTSISLGSVSIDIDAVNDDPENIGSLPMDIAVTEDIPSDINLSDIDLYDPDSAAGDLTLTLITSAGGTLTASSGTGVITTGSGTNQITLTGTQANLNTFVNVAANIQFTSAPNLNGINADTLRVTVNDNGNTGLGGGSIVNLGNINIDIAAVNDDPVNTGSLPPTITVTEDNASDFDLSVVNINDVDANGDLRILLTSANAGNLFASTGNGVNVTGTGTPALTLAGDQTDLNVFLNNPSSIQYLHSSGNLNGANADTINVAVSDNGNTGSGGGSTIDIGNISVDIDAVNDDPTNTGTFPTDITVTEDVPSDVDLSGINLTDIDAAANNLTITLTTSAGGLLSITPGSGISVSSSGIGQLSLTGNESDLNTFLNAPSNIQYTGPLDSNGDNTDTIQVDVTDNGNTGTGGGNSVTLGTVNVDITAVNDDPTNNGSLPNTIEVTEDVLSEFDLFAIELEDIDATGNLTITVSTATGGTLVSISGSGVTVGGSTTAILTLNGSQADLNTFLNNANAISYLHATPNLNGLSADTISVSVTDNGNTGSGGGSAIELGTINVDILAINDDPNNTGTLPTSVTVTEDVASDFDVSTVNIVDIDATGDLTITLTSVNGGNLFASTRGGVSVTNSATTSIALTGTQADLNTYLNDNTSISYLNSTSDLNGTNADTINITVSDNGHSGNGGGGIITLGSVSVNIDPVNDDPINVGTLPADINAIEDISSDVNLASINLFDVDAATDILTVTLSTSTGGSLTAIGGAGITVANSGSNQINLTGTQNALNTYFNQPGSIQYIGVLNANGNNADIIEVTVTDNGNIGTGGGSPITLGLVDVHISPVNDDPINDGTLVANVPVTEDIASNIDLSMLNLVDIDSALGDLTLTLTTNTGGTLSASAGNGVVATGSGSNRVTLTGNLLDLNNYLNDSSSIQYLSALNSNGNAIDTIQVDVTDNGHTGAGGANVISLGQITVDSTAVNDDPINAGTLPATLVVIEDTFSNIDLSAVNLSDIDAGISPLTLTISSANGGLLTAAANSNVDTIGTGSTQLTLTGSLINLNAYLNTATNLQYKSPADANGNGADSIQINLTDNGNTGTGGGSIVNIGTVALDISAVNDAPNAYGIENATLAYTENDGAKPITATLTLSDIDHSILQSAAIQITGNHNGTEDILHFNVPGNITGSWDSSTGTLSLSGSDTVANYQSALRNVTYQNISENPDESIRTVSFTVNDGAASSTTQYRDIAISRVNDAPAGTDNTATLLEDTFHVFTPEEFGFNDLLDSHTLLAIEVSTLPVNGTLTLNDNPLQAGDTVESSDIATGSLRYTPLPNGYGDIFDNFEFKVQDNGGTVADGVDTDPTTNVMTLRVISVNDAPQGTDAVVTTLEDTDIVLSAVDFGFNDPLDTNDLLAVKISVLPDNGALELNGNIVAAGQSIALTQIDNNELTFVPAENAHDTPLSTVYFQVQDNGGTLDGGIDLDPTANALYINVTSVNDEPAGTDNTVSTLEDTAYTFSVTDFGFSDPYDGNQMDSLVITSLPSNGELTLSGQSVITGQSVTTAEINAGLFLFNPESNNYGSGYANFGFQLRDDGGNLNTGIDQDSTPNTVTIDVISVNDAPSGADNLITTLEDTDYILRITDFGYTDNLDSNAFESVTLAALPTRGELTLDTIPVTEGMVISVTDIAAGLLVFSPEQNVNGDHYDQIDFHVTDNGGLLDGGSNTDPKSNSLLIYVYAVNDAPQGGDNTIEFTEDTIYIFQTTDFNFSDDLDGHSFSAVTITSIPESGALTLSGLAVQPGDMVTTTDINNGNLRFTPHLNANGTGPNGFEFKVHDDGGTSNGGVDIDPTANSVTFDLAGINDPPQLISNETTVDEGSDTLLTAEMLYGTDVDDTEPQDLTITLNSVPVNGVLTLAGTPLTIGDTVSLADIANDQVRYIHDGSETSIDFFDVSLADGGEDGVQPVRGRFSLIINEVIDPAPELTEDSLTLPFGESFDSNSGYLLDSGSRDLNTNNLLGNNQYTINIEIPPEHGTLELSEDGKFSYMHDGSQYLQDSFTYRVTNEDGVFSLATIEISIEPSFNAALDITPVQEVAAENIEEKQSEAEEELQVEQSPAQELIPPTVKFEKAEPDTLEVLETSQIAIDSFVFVNNMQDQLHVLQHKSIEQATINYDPAKITTSNINISIEIPADYAQSYSNNSHFLNGLNQLENEMNEATDNNGRTIQLLDDAVMGVSISILAGALSWALRGGALAASLLTATPLWSTIDPGKVFISKSERNKADAEAEEDNVEKIFNAQA